MAATEVFRWFQLSRIECNSGACPEDFNFSKEFFAPLNRDLLWKLTILLGEVFS